MFGVNAFAWVYFAQAFLPASHTAVRMCVSGNYRPSLAVTGTYSARVSVTGTLRPTLEITGSFDQAVGVSGTFRPTLDVTGEWKDCD